MWMLIQIFYKFVEKGEEVLHLRTTMRQLQELMRFVNRGEVPVERQWPFNPMFDGNPFEEDREEERPSPDEVVKPITRTNGTATVGSAEGDHEAPYFQFELYILKQNMVLKMVEKPMEVSDGRNNGDRPVDEDEDESFEDEETLDQRYQRYMQSTMDEVSDPDEWCEMHYGLAMHDEDDVPTEGGDMTRSRSLHEDDDVGADCQVHAKTFG
eukprot:s575_g13.t1